MAFPNGNKLQLLGSGSSGKRWKVKDTSKMSLARKGKIPKNLALLHSLPRTKEWGLKISRSNTGRRWSAVSREKVSGENSPYWNPNRDEVTKNSDGRNDQEYREWRMRVWLRDAFKCKISNTDCDGRLETHHILGWSEHVELRYEVNNGITLCHAHHPKRRAEEKRLVPVFQGLVSVSKF